MTAEELLRKLKDMGVDTDQLADALKKLDKDSSPEEIAEAIGRVIGKLGSGVAAGTYGLDPGLLGGLLSTLGPAALSALDKIIDKLLPKGGDYDTRKPGGSPWKRERITHEGVDDDHAPDLNFRGTMIPTCGTDDTIHVLVKGSIMFREEVVSEISVVVYDKKGDPIADSDEHNAVDDQNSDLRPRKAIDKANAAKNRWVPFETTVIVPCHYALLANGHLLIQVTVKDGDGNYMVDFRKVSCAALLLDPDAPCCKSFKTEDYLNALKERITAGMKESGISIKDLLDELMAPPEDADKPEEKPTKKDKKAKRKEEKEAEKKISKLIRTADPEILTEIEPVEVEITPENS